MSVGPPTTVAAWADIMFKVESGEKPAQPVARPPGPHEMIRCAYACGTEIPTRQRDDMAWCPNCIQWFRIARPAAEG